MLIQSIANTNLPIVCDHKVRLNEIQDVRADISFANKLLGWQPSVDFNNGIRIIFNALDNAFFTTENNIS